MVDSARMNRVLLGMLFVFLFASSPVVHADPLERSALHSAEELFEKPTVILYEIIEENSPQSEITTIGEMHGIYPVSPEALISVLFDFDRYDEINDRTVVSTAEQIDTDPNRWIQHMELSFGAVFFSADYRFDLAVTDETPRLSVPGAGGFSYRLDRSDDGKLGRLDGSWYVEPILMNGNRYSYLRYASTIEYTERVFGLRFALRNFAVNDMKKTMESFVEAAAEREGNGD